MMAFFLIQIKIMSKRYSGKSFKDSSVKKKPKMGFKEKRKFKREKRKNSNQLKNTKFIQA